MTVKIEAKRRQQKLHVAYSHWIGSLQLRSLAMAEETDSSASQGDRRLVMTLRMSPAPPGRRASCRNFEGSRSCAERLESVPSRKVIGES